MAYHKPIETPFTRKTKVMEKLFASGIKTEKDLQALGIERILKIKDIAVPDMTVIMELQQSVKAHTLFSYLGGDDNEPTSKDG